jgi:hypothetical protein
MKSASVILNELEYDDCEKEVDPKVFISTVDSALGALRVLKTTGESI